MIQAVLTLYFLVEFANERHNSGVQFFNLRPIFPFLTENNWKRTKKFIYQIDVPGPNTPQDIIYATSNHLLQRGVPEGLHHNSTPQHWSSMRFEPRNHECQAGGTNFVSLAY